MPSSSSGQTPTELLLSSQANVIIAHLHYHANTTQLPTTRNLPAQPSPNLTIHIIDFLSTTLDAPTSSRTPVPTNPDQDQDQDHTHASALRPPSKATIASIREIAMHRPLPSQLLESLATWLDEMAQTLAQRGRVSEAEQALALKGGVLRWAEPEGEGERDVGRGVEESRKGLEGVCLRWGS
ncbi:hypothetical protein CAC42_3436 [Sphaceloma murrayae]|uniref:Uncharacterized protein n=1 Tax=Sphaceloma murrayae TaxID=2082308 RepID=A0A2K1R1C9_9PEZI|nr:hypothetical protein CAC42_3436 [Sphaceloma murrayae]